MLSWLCRNGWGSLSVGRAGLPASTAPPNATSARSPRTTPRCERSCSRSRAVAPDGGTGVRTGTCSIRAGR